LRRADRRPDVEVTAFIGVPWDAPDAVPRFIIMLRNRSTSDVHLSGVGLFFPTGIWPFTPWRGPQNTWRIVPWIHPAPVPRLIYPYTLPAGKSARDMMSLQQISRDLVSRGDRGEVRLRGFVVAETGYMYSSRSLNFNASHWELPWSYAPPGPPPPPGRLHTRIKRRSERKMRFQPRTDS
jgi:hypothetical protein